MMQFFPIFRLAGGIVACVIALLLLPLIPPKIIGGVAAVVGVYCLIKSFYFVSGVLLGMASVSFFIAPPVDNVYTNCSYQAVISSADYSQQRLGKAVTLNAEQIICQSDGKTQPLPKQKLLFYDSGRQLQDYTNRNVILHLQSQLHPVHGRLNHYAFDYEKYLHENAIRLQVKKPTVLAVTPSYNPVIRLRNGLARSIQAHLPNHEAAIILALLTGNRSALTPQQKLTMQKTGSSHILAISGLHLALVGGWMWLIIQWCWGLSLRLNRYLQPIQAGAIGALVIITLYALVSGFDIPVRRAWLMFSLLIIAWLTLKPVNTYSLLLAACVVVLLDPYAVLSVGFYFSFTATAIVLWSVRLPYPPLLKIIIMQAVISLTLMPITWFVFGTVALGGFLTNLLIIPWLGLWVLPVAFIAVIASLFSDSIVLWQLLQTTTHALWQTIAWFAQQDWHISPLTRPHLIAVIVAVSSILLALYHKKWRYAVGFLVLFVPIPQHVTPALVIADSRYTSALIHNGSAALLLNPGRKYQHINQADKWLRYLAQHRLKLSAIILSDEKISHISATQSLLQRFPTAQVITLKDFPLPYPSQYCTAISIDHLSLNTTQYRNHCQAHLTWFKQNISLTQNKTTENALLKKSQLRWDNQLYDAKKLGAITITPDNPVTYLRQNEKPWRKTITLTTAKSPTHVARQSDVTADTD